MKQTRVLIIAGLLLMLLLLFAQASGGHQDVVEMKYSAFIKAVRDGEISSVVAQGDVITGELNEGARGQYDNKSRFATVGTLNADVQDLMNERGVVYEYKLEEEDSWWQLMLIYSLPTLLLIGVFIFFFRQSQSGGSKAMSFGRSKARMLEPEEHKVTFRDIAGVDEAKAELEEIVDFLKNPSKYQRLGARIPKGVLLMGAPGTGKTLLAKGVAGEAGVPFFTMSGSDFVEMFVGVGASRVRDLFEQAKKVGRCILFIDEIDAVGRHRGTGLGGGHDEREQTLNQLLVEMDGFEPNVGIIVMAATNRPDVLDPALLRPGRFDRRVTVPSPDVRGRKSILEVHTKDKPLHANVDLGTLAHLTSGASGAELGNICNEAALIAAARNAESIEQRDFLEARDRIVMGRERKSMVVTEREKRTTAYHEAGHAIVTLFLNSEEVDKLSKVTIVPRGRALGITYSQPKEDRLSYSKQYTLNSIAILMGGRVSEELIFEHLTTGAGNDLEKATNLARYMVVDWGMSERLGPVAFGDKDHQPFLGRELSSSRNYSEKTAELIDEEVRRFLLEGYGRAKQILEEQIDKLHLLSAALIEFETLDASDVMLLFEEGMEAVRQCFAKREEEERLMLERVQKELEAKPELAAQEQLGALRPEAEGPRAGAYEDEEDDLAPIELKPKDKGEVS